MRTTHRLLCTLVCGLFVGCAEDEGDIGSEEDAEHAYLGLDTSIEKALNLGMDGYNAASNANIPDQSGEGDETGTITVGGQVDQGASDNKEMRLTVALVDYSDGPVERVDDEELNITYDTGDDLPDLTLSLRDIPNGTFEGTLVGTYEMHGDLEGTVSLDLMMSGAIEAEGMDGITRTIGETHVTGVATSGDSHYDVDVTI